MLTGNNYQVEIILGPRWAPKTTFPTSQTLPTSPDPYVLAWVQHIELKAQTLNVPGQGLVWKATGSSPRQQEPTVVTVASLGLASLSEQLSPLPLPPHCQRSWCWSWSRSWGWGRGNKGSLDVPQSTLARPGSYQDLECPGLSDNPRQEGGQASQSPANPNQRATGLPARW